ncbi:hypothetical protein FFT09_20105 [Saccharomonospora piscinae]|uniref:hypothetical protein n=1 Tax=Saccharomonospora piscinae TaxID=687388 RepID=UPI001105D965|nr:hypothetical protein [Saccharomonospora piscinae]TLW90654.1 hypothetical protein FFT09_20105 [Saccharomonospora piscinae]
MAISRFEPWEVLSNSADVTGWFAPVLHDAPRDNIRALVPDMYPQYVRLLHPAYQERPKGKRMVQWKEIAAYTNRVFHPLVQFPNLVGLRLQQYESGINENEGKYGPWTDPPEQGTLPPEIIGSVVEVLRRCTDTPDNCFFALWSGWADVRRLDIAKAAHLRLPGRDYIVFQGAIDTAKQSVFKWRFQAMNLWWPADRRWFLATDIDLESTYIGIDDNGMEAMMNQDLLETIATDPNNGITTSSDSVNPSPAP